MEKLPRKCQRSASFRKGSKQSAGLHPTMKPVELMERSIHNSSLSGDLVLDCVGGSGSTLIAAGCREGRAPLYVFHTRRAGNVGRRRYGSDGFDVLALVAPDSVSQRQGQEALFAS